MPRFSFQWPGVVERVLLLISLVAYACNGKTRLLRRTKLEMELQHLVELHHQVN
jgi:hypothetical protein